MWSNDQVFLSKYNILEKEGVPICGFLVNVINKVKNILEKSIVKYIVVEIFMKKIFTTIF